MRGRPGSVDLPEWSDVVLDRVIIDDGCWSWDGKPDREGYQRASRGSYRNGRKEQRRAHRLVYEEMRGPLTPGLTLDHLCRNTECVNPWHLEEVSFAENRRRAHGV